MEYPYLLQEKRSTDTRWSTVYGFGLGSEMQKRFDEYKSYWENRQVRIVQNPKYKTKKLNIPIPDKLNKGY